MDGMRSTLQQNKKSATVDTHDAVREDQSNAYLAIQANNIRQPTQVTDAEPSHDDDNRSGSVPRCQAPAHASSPERNPGIAPPASDSRAEADDGRDRGHSREQPRGTMHVVQRGDINVTGDGPSFFGSNFTNATLDFRRETRSRDDNQQ